MLLALTMPDLTLHIAPHAPWLALTVLSVALAGLGIWAYRFGFPPLTPVARRLLPLLRVLSLLAILWLFVQPVLERTLPASGRRVVVLKDVSASMALAAAPGGASRAQAADEAARQVQGALRGRARVETREFAAGLQALSAGDSARGAGREATALGEALAALAALPADQQPDGVVVLSDGITNAGRDPVAAARTLGVPVHTLVTGEALGADRAIAEIEASAQARVGDATPVRVHVRSSEPKGAPIEVTLREDGRVLGSAKVAAPGPGLEALAQMRVTPARAGLGVWTASVAALAGDAVPQNDARQVAVPVARAKLGVLIVAPGLDWDLAFLRRALSGDSALAIDTRVRQRGGAWRSLESRREGALDAGALHGVAVVVLAGIAGPDIGAPFDAALAAFVREGGGLLLLGSDAPGLARYARGALGRELALQRAGADPAGAGTLAPQPEPAAADEILAWDDDPARGAQAWRAAAPLADVLALRASAADRVLVKGTLSETPLLFSRRVGRGPVMMINGTGYWRWSLSGTDALAAERGKRLWRHVVRWLSEPVQGEPLRVQPEHWLVAGGERVKLLATLQDDAFRPIADARVEGSASDGHGHSVALAFTPRGNGGYEAVLPAPAPGRWQVQVRARGAGPQARDLGHARSEFAVDTWSLEALRSDPDSAALALVAEASGGRHAHARDAAAWARALETRELTRRRTSSLRLWESPWVFAIIILMLASEWIWRRRRGLP